MKIIEFTTYSENSPVTGFGVWLVLDEGRRAHLLHPVHLTELIVTEYEYKSGRGNTLWPENSTGCSFDADRFMKSLKNRIAFFLENRRPFPIQTIAKAIAGLEEISLEESMNFIRSLTSNDDNYTTGSTQKASRVYRVREVDKVDFSLIGTGRPLTIYQTLKEHGSASIYELTSLLEGKLKTKSDLCRVVTYFVNKLTSRGVLEIVV